MRGQYRVKSEDLKPLFERAKKMVQSFSSFRITHVYREQNSEADALANQALDETGRGGSSSAVSATPKEITIRRTGRSRSGRLELDDPLPFPDGTEVEVLIRPKK